MTAYTAFRFQPMALRGGWPGTELAFAEFQILVNDGSRSAMIRVSKGAP